MGKAEGKVTAADIEGPDRLEEIVARKMTLEDTVQEIVTGAKQKKRDNYKRFCLETIMGMQRVMPSQKQDVNVSGDIRLRWKE